MVMRAVKIEGRNFKSISEAAEHFDIAVGSVAHRCTSTLAQWKKWKYVSEATRIPGSLKIMIGRNRYPSIRKAADAIGVAMSTVRTRLVSAEYPTYAYITADGEKCRSGAELAKALER